MRVDVIGAGTIGAAKAPALALRGLAVALLGLSPFAPARFARRP